MCGPTSPAARRAGWWSAGPPAPGRRPSRRSSPEEGAPGQGRARCAARSPRGRNSTAFSVHDRDLYRTKGRGVTKSPPPAARAVLPRLGCRRHARRQRRDPAASPVDVPAGRRRVVDHELEHDLRGLVARDLDDPRPAPVLRLAVLRLDRAGPGAVGDEDVAGLRQPVGVTEKGRVERFPARCRIRPRLADGQRLPRRPRTRRRGCRNPRTASARRTAGRGCCRCRRGGSCRRE